MYVVTSGKKITWPVKFKTPADGGKFDEQEFSVKFKRLTRKESEDKLKALEESGKTGLDQSQAFFVDVIDDWSSFVDAENQPIPFSAEALQAQYEGFDALPFNNGLWNAWNELAVGARSKN